MTDVKAPEPDAEVLAARKRRRRRWTWGGVISTAASIATIVSVLNATGSSSSSSSSGTTFSYPGSLQAEILNSCEASNPTSTCGCALTWLENNVSAGRANQDEVTFTQTGDSPADFNDAVGNC